MPFTPYHFGPSACIALPLRRYIDIPVFILANVAVDLEPLAVILFDLNYPMHGYFHTFLVGTAVALGWGLIAYSGKSTLQWLMKLFHVSYEANLGKMLLSAILGAWFHLLIDSICWYDMRPFWPLDTNPFINLMTLKTVRLLCTISFLPAIVLYIIAVASYVRKNKGKNSG